MLMPPSRLVSRHWIILQFRQSSWKIWNMSLFWCGFLPCLYLWSPLIIVNSIIVMYVKVAKQILESILNTTLVWYTVSEMSWKFSSVHPGTNRFRIDNPCTCSRLLEIISNKIFAIQPDNVLLECITNSTGTKAYRIEEIPLCEVEIGQDETLVPVAHFQKVCVFLFIKLYLY